MLKYYMNNNLHNIIFIFINYDALVQFIVFNFIYTISIKI